MPKVLEHFLASRWFQVFQKGQQPVDDSLLDLYRDIEPADDELCCFYHFDNCLLCHFSSLRSYEESCAGRPRHSASRRRHGISVRSPLEAVSFLHHTITNVAGKHRGTQTFCPPSVAPSPNNETKTWLFAVPALASALYERLSQSSGSRVPRARL